jgi:hypothetical protein
MKIDPKFFENEGELDFSDHYKEGSRTGKVSLRKAAKDLYEIYVKWYYPKDCETILFKGTLGDCISFSNAKFDLNYSIEK